MVGAPLRQSNPGSPSPSQPTNHPPSAHTHTPSPPPAEIKRTHVPQRDGEDPYLPAAPYDPEAAATPSLPPLDPLAVAAQAAQLEALGRHPAARDDATLPPAGKWRSRMRRKGAGGAGSGVMDSVSKWSDLELLDRGVLEERLVQELAAKVGCAPVLCCWGCRGWCGCGFGGGGLMWICDGLSAGLPRGSQSQPSHTQPLTPHPPTRLPPSSWAVRAPTGPPPPTGGPLTSPSDPPPPRWTCSPTIWR